MDFETCFKVYNIMVSVHAKSIKLGQMTTLNEAIVIFHAVVSVYRLVQI